MPIVLHQVSFAYPPGLPVLDKVSCSFEESTVTALTGPSGSGKTTLLMLIGGLLEPQHGAISGRPTLEYTRWVFQVPTVLTRRTVLDNILLGLHQQRGDTESARTKAIDVANRMGLSHLLERAAGTLSGGELQRTQIARAVVGAPPLVLADEPTGQLDQANTERVVMAMSQMRQPGSITIVATHDPQVASACDRVIDLRTGLPEESAT